MGSQLTVKGGAIYLYDAGERLFKTIGIEPDIAADHTEKGERCCCLVIR